MTENIEGAGRNPDTLGNNRLPSGNTPNYNNPTPIPRAPQVGLSAILNSLRAFTDQMRDECGQIRAGHERIRRIESQLDLCLDYLDAYAEAHADSEGASAA